jgi:A/G-specific adenine glycosylase
LNNKFFAEKVIRWYQYQHRDLAWRHTRDPYYIWLSEVILQQTRIAQGLPYYERFVKTYPTVFDLASAPEQDVIRLWQGLGYYSRARNLHQTAKYIAQELNGKFPETYAQLLKLKGIGPYTAAAIASFAYDEAVAVVDGNVYRVLARVFGIETDIGSTQGQKQFAQLANELIPHDQPATYNQAIMEFGALQCVPKNPNCEVCIFGNSCAALQKKKVAQLPVKSKKTKVTNRFFNYLIFLDKHNNTLINKRTQKGIWHNLYEFPVIETNDESDFDVIFKNIIENYPEYTFESISCYNSAPVIHKLSHQKLHINYYKLNVMQEIMDGIPLFSIKNYPFPVVIYNFIEKYSI